jgi:hypothetical protein
MSAYVYTPKNKEERAKAVHALRYAREVGDSIGIMVALLQLQQYAEEVSE